MRQQIYQSPDRSARAARTQIDVIRLYITAEGVTIEYGEEMTAGEYEEKGEEA